MYHAISGTGVDCDPPEPHYTVARQTFRDHLALVRATGYRPVSLARVLEEKQAAGNVVFTFDDGHASNAAAALDILDSDGSADLFVNPSRVGERNFLDWRALDDLARAGISIQSHGDTHRYFDELSDQEIERELYTSKTKIEDQLGRPVFLFAPPGGRLKPQVEQIARRLGYRGMCTSKPGVWRTRAPHWNIPRFAVLGATNDRQIRRWIDQNGWELATMKARNGGLALAKQLLGNDRYDALRARLLALARQHGPSTRL